MRIVTMAGALNTVLSLTACGDSDVDEALRHARKACEFKPRLYQDPATETSRPVNVDKNSRGYRQAASLAARAARLDPRWDELNRAYSALVDAWSWAKSLSATPTGFAGVDPELAKSYLERSTQAEATIRAECLKAEM